MLDNDQYACNIDAIDKYGDTALFNACRMGNIEVIQKVISAEPECNRLFVNHITKESPAHIACRKNRLDILKLLLTEGISMQLNHLLLHIACENDSKEIVDFLIDNALSPNISISVTETVLSPIHIAVSYTHLRAHETLRYLVCRLLLEKKKMKFINSA